MHPTLILVVGLVVATAAAVRSTWSPCGLSMLSSLTPFGERARGHRYAATATWYLAGAVLGGLSLGAVSGAAAMAVHASGLSARPGAVAAILALGAVAAAGVDAGALGVDLPVIRRQVDDGWLVRYRPWVYGAGFGWQIGVGVATYVMTAGVFLVPAVGALGGRPATALAVCGWFGLIRGLSVWLTARATTPERLRGLHARFDAAGPAARWAVVAIELAVGATAVGQRWGATASVAATAAITLGGLVLWRRHNRVVVTSLARR